jgi:hypothetical protein
VPAPGSSPPRLTLDEIVGPDILQPIMSAKAITFHAVDDTGAAKTGSFQTPAQALAHEAGVADAMARGVRQGGAAAPAFFFHLGDVVYHFGEAQYYYDQFYEPFRACDRPIFAIPGNHDGMVFGDDPSTPKIPTLPASGGTSVRRSPDRRRTRARSCATVVVDMSGRAATLAIDFRAGATTTPQDSVTVNLATGTLATTST